MTTQSVERQAAIAFGGVTPVLRVGEMNASVDYYTRVLGFTLNWRYPGFASVSRGRCYLFLSAGDQGNPGSWVWIAADVDALYEEYRASGAKIRNPPTNYEWSLEMQVEDLDGNVLRLGGEPRKDEPFGDWLDMYGVRHKPWNESDKIA